MWVTDILAPVVRMPANPRTRRRGGGGHVEMNARQNGSALSAFGASVEVDESSPEEAFETLLTSLALSNVLTMPDAEREALFERILSGEGVTLERDGDCVEIHLVGKTIATLDLHWLVRNQGPSWGTQ